MNILVDRCTGRRLAEWLRIEGHDILGAWEPGVHPGDQALLEHAEAEQRIRVTLDTDFGELIHLYNMPHSGLVRLRDVPVERRIALMTEVLEQHQDALDTGAVVTVRRRRIRVSRWPRLQ